MLCKYYEELCSLDKDDFKSIKKQLKAFQRLQYYIWIDVADNQDQNERLSSKYFVFGFVAPWQAAYFEHAQFVSLDAIHDVLKYKDSILYTMVIHDPMRNNSIYNVFY